MTCATLPGARSRPIHKMISLHVLSTLIALAGLQIVATWRTARALIRKVDTMSQDFDALSAVVADLTATIAQLKTDVEAVIARLPGDTGLTRDEATQIRNMLGEIKTSLSGLDTEAVSATSATSATGATGGDAPPTGDGSTSGTDTDAPPSGDGGTTPTGDQ